MKHHYSDRQRISSINFVVYEIVNERNPFDVIMDYVDMCY